MEQNNKVIVLKENSKKSIFDAADCCSKYKTVERLIKYFLYKQLEEQTESGRFQIQSPPVWSLGSCCIFFKFIWRGKKNYVFTETQCFG